MPLIETSHGVKIHYDDMGEGQPIVLIHGWGGSGVLWRFQGELADDYRLIIPDLRGHGGSTAAGEGFGLQDLADDIVILFERLDLRGAILLGWSLGSQVAMASFPRLKGRISGLVLVGATARFTSGAGYPHGLAESEIRGMGLRLKRGFERTMEEFFRSMFAMEELTAEQEGRICREILAEGMLPSREAADAGLAILASTDLREMLPQIDCPVLVVHGSADAICPPGSARYLAERIPNARLFEFAGAGHAPSLSRPEQFNAILREFILKETDERN